MSTSFRRRNTKIYTEPRWRSNSKGNQLTKIPDISFIEVASQGFSSFHSWDQSSMGNPETVDSLKTIQRQTPQLAQLNQQLKQNRSNLELINQKVQRRRLLQYEQYVASSLRYGRLLQLNNNRSKMLTSLNSKKVGQIKVTQVQTQRHDIIYGIEVQKLEIEGWKPQVREGQSCLVYRGVVYVIGGHNNYPINKVSTFNISNNSWSPSFDSDFNRTYHSLVVYRNLYCIFFGGMGNYNSHYKTRQCLNSCVLFNLGSQTLKNIKIENDILVEPRRQHTACLIGRHMIVFGGINTKKRYLSDIKILSLKALKWEEREYKVESQQLYGKLTLGIAKHAAFTLFKQRENCAVYNKEYQSHEGMYVFGGCNQSGHEYNLLQFSFSKRVPTISEVITSGQKPSSVYPIVQKYKDNIVIILSGERHERQLYLLKVLEGEYVRIKCLDSLGGVGSSIVQHDEKFYILFGLSGTGYAATITKVNITEKKVEKVDLRKAVTHTRLFQRRPMDETSSSQNIG